jgi:dTDP-4-amino-4,6-dideoxygalactose transaminase
MNELEAAVGLGNLKKYDNILKKRRKNLASLMEGFQSFRPFLETISEEKGEQIGPHAMPAWVPEEAPFTRNEIVGYLEKQGIDTRSLFQSMPTQCPGFAFLGYKTGQFPNAEYIGNAGFHFGVHHGMGKADVQYILECIGDFLDLYN